MKVQKSLYNSHIPPWVLLPLRLFLGVTFVYAGIQKFTDPQFFHTGTAGFIGRQMTGFAKGSPIGGFLLNVVAPHALLFGYLVSYGEIAIGLGVLVGLLFRPAAFFGMFVSLIFFLSVTWHVYPYFYGVDIVFAFAWLTLLLNGPLNTGLPTLDEFLTLRFLQLSSPERQTGLAGAMHFILGTTVRPQEQISETAPQVAVPAQGQQPRGQQQPQLRQQQRRQVAAQIAQEKRRSFLRGTLTGGAGILGLGALIYVFRALITGYENSAVQTPAQGSDQGATSTAAGNGSGDNGAGTSGTTPTPNATPTVAAGGAIAQVKAVPANSSTTFTIPSSGDPGILVHLSSGQFVAYDALCTHAGCQVDYDPGQQLLVCPCHGAAFDPTRAAAVVQGPAPTPLPSVSIRVDSATGAITLS